jgi:hypothetical protein
MMAKARKGRVEASSLVAALCQAYLTVYGKYTMGKEIRERIAVGTPVEYNGQKTQVISGPLVHNGVYSVLCANVGSWIPVTDVKPIKG